MPREIDTDGRTLRQHAARGTIINAGFLIGITTLGLLRGWVVAAFLTRADYGIWGILLVGIGSLSWLKGAAVADRYVQQDESDQELAFQRAFSAEVVVAAALTTIVLISLPIFAVVYGQPRIVAPGLVAAFVLMPALALQAPLWIFYRRMEFARQRRLQAIDPVVGFVVTVILAVTGFGYWALMLGGIAGAVASAAVALRALPYRLRLRFESASLRDYLSFSWPIFVSGLAALVVAQCSLLIGNAALGIGAVGAITLASSITGYADQLDEIVTSTLYPAICAVRDRTDLLGEAFVKSNRLALMWGMPFGVGLALFAPDLVHFLLGAKWRPATSLIQIFGLVAAGHQIAFNWTAFLRARGDTRPLAIVNTGVAILFVAAVIPLTLADGLNGFGLAMAITAAGGLAARMHYLGRIFPGFGVLRHCLRAVLPSVPAAGAVLALRLAHGGPRSAPLAAVELAFYLAVTVAGTVAFERPLLREVLGYLQPRSAPHPRTVA